MACVPGRLGFRRLGIDDSDPSPTPTVRNRRGPRARRRVAHPRPGVKLGRAAALDAQAERPQFLIVRDTRESGPMLEEALAAGIAAGGGDAMLGGVLPTPAASVSPGASASTWRRSSPPPTTPSPTTGSSSSTIAAPSSTTSGSSRSRGGWTIGPARESAGSARSRGRSTTTSGSCGPRFSSTSRACGSHSTARTAPPTARRR